MVEYKTSNLGNIGNVCMCKRVLKSQTSKSGEIPFYKISTFGGQADAFIDKKMFEEYKKKYNYPKKGDVLISASGTLGKIVEYDGKDAYFQDSNIVWIANDEKKVLNKYLKYFYETKPWIKTNSSTIERLYNDNIRAIEIRYPVSLEQQKAIIKPLELIDYKIAINNKIIGNLKDYCKTVYEHWFLQFDFPDNNGKPYASSNNKMIWNEEISKKIPVGWEVKMVKDFGKLTMGQSPKGNTYNSNSEGVPLLNGATELTENGISINKYTLSPTRICHVNDWIFCIRATLGNIQKADKEYCLGRGVASFTPKVAIYDEYIYFNIYNILERYKKTLSGSIIVGIQKDEFNNSLMISPPCDIIEKFHLVTSKVFKKINTLEKQNINLIELKQSILPNILDI